MKITAEVAEQIGRFCHPAIVSQAESLVGVDTDVAVAALRGLTEINRAQRALVEEMMYVRAREAEMSLGPIDVAGRELPSGGRALPPGEDYDDD